MTGHLDRLFIQYRKYNRWLVSLQDKRIPQLFVAASGVTGILVGLLFLTLPSRFDSSESLYHLTNVVPTEAWVVIFFGFGFILFTCAIVNYSAAAIPTFLFGCAMFIFTIMTVVDVVEGPATGVVSVLALAFGFINILTSIMATAPITEARIHTLEEHERMASRA